MPQQFGNFNTLYFERFQPCGPCQEMCFKQLADVQLILGKFVSFEIKEKVAMRTGKGSLAVGLVYLFFFKKNYN